MKTLNVTSNETRTTMTKKEMLNEIKALEGKAYARIRKEWKIGSTLTREEIAALSGGFLTENNIRARTATNGGFRRRPTGGRIVFNGNRDFITFSITYVSVVKTYQNVEDSNDVIKITRWIPKYTRT